MLVTFIVLYLLFSVAIGLLAARCVHNTADCAVSGLYWKRATMQGTPDHSERVHHCQGTAA